MRDLVEKALDEIRPSLQADGGDIELVSVDDQGAVRIRIIGKAPGMPMTLLMTIEPMIKERVPAVRAVVVVP